MDNMMVYFAVLCVMTIGSLYLKKYFETTKQDGLMVMGTKGVVVMVMLLFCGLPVRLLFVGTEGRNGFFRPAEALRNARAASQSRFEKRRQREEILKDQLAVSRIQLNQAKTAKIKKDDL